MQNFPAWPRPRNESARLAALRQLAILDQPADAELEGLARVASYVCDAPMAAVNLIDEDRQFQAAAHGKERDIVPRDMSFCGYAILHEGVTYTPDASRDEVFRDHPFVTGVLGSIRLYASAPVVVEEGFVVGSLCVFGEEPGELREEQLLRLADLAGVAARLLDLRRAAGSFAAAATTDQLTGLANRAFFDERLEDLIERRESGTSVGVLYLDLDGFKPVNDAYGHQAGDLVLQTIAARLALHVRATDIAARLGGDEFTVAVTAAGGEQIEKVLDTLTQRLSQELSAPIKVGDSPTSPVISVGVSIGRAVVGPMETVAEALERADAAMYLAKAFGGGPTEPVS